MSRDEIQRGIADYTQWVNPLAAKRAELAGEPLALVRVAPGGALEDADGRVFHDFVSGFGTQALGHRNPHVGAAVRAFLDSDEPSFFPSGVSPFAGRLARRLGERTGYGSVTFSSTGTEAVEAALKLARAATGRARIVGLEGGFHGCTMGSLALMTPGPFRDRFAPHLPAVESLPFGATGALESTLAAGGVAAVVVEPIQVEGGVRALPPAFARALCDLTTRYGALLVADEAQTGLCRTGSFVASAAWPRRPDILVLAKALGGGLAPLSATLTSRDLFARAYGAYDTAETHQSTFSGNAIACVAGLAALDLFTTELAERVHTVGAWFRGALADALTGLPLVREVRGAGLLVGIELADIDHPWLGFEALGLPEFAGRPSAGPLVCHRLFRRGFLIQVAGHDWRVVRIQPALDVAESSLAAFVTACREEIEILCRLL